MIYIVTGQTATGKTKYAVKLAEKYNGELINCDARQIYQKLDIITGKDLHLMTDDGRLTTKIWLYDIVDPKTPFSSHEYRQHAIAVIKDILARGKTPIIVGGTYFYLRNLLYNYQDTFVEPDWELRDELGGKTIRELQKKLHELNPDYFEALNNSEKNNPQRLIRKIEIALESPESMKLAFPTKIKLLEEFPQEKIEMTGFYFNSKENLISAIDKRVENRLKQGAVEEVQRLLQNGYTADDPGLKTIGYSQCINYLEKKISYADMIEEWKSKEVKYAKRQYTFMKKDNHIAWIEV